MHLLKFAVAWLLLPCAVAHAANDIDMDKLSETKIALVEVTKAGSPAKSFVAATLIGAPVQQLCTLIQQYEAYPSFMPNTTATKVSYKGAGFSIIDVTLGLPLGKVKKYRLRMEPEVAADSCKIAWKLVPWAGLKPEETLVDTTGYWHLAPSKVPGKSAVKYVVNTDAGPIPFGLGWIADSLSKDSIPQMLGALRKRAAAKQGLSVP